MHKWNLFPLTKACIATLLIILLRQKKKRYTRQKREYSLDLQHTVSQSHKNNITPPPDAVRCSTLSALHPPTPKDSRDRGYPVSSWLMAQLLTFSVVVQRPLTNHPHNGPLFKRWPPLGQSALSTLSGPFLPFTSPVICQPTQLNKYPFCLFWLIPHGSDFPVLTSTPARVYTQKANS